MNASKIYTEKVLSKINAQKAGSSNLIFVVQGQADLLDLDQFADSITEPESFTKNDNDTFFDKTWFAGLFIKLNAPKDFHLVSYPQFSYLTAHLDANFFKERVVILRDNLRVLFPIGKEEFIASSILENEIEERPVEIPVYQAEQLVIDENYFYSIKSPIVDFRTVDLFDVRVPLLSSDDETLSDINLGSDPFGLDVFINAVFAKNNFSNHAVVTIQQKQPNSERLRVAAELLNGFMHEFGGGVFLKEVPALSSTYIPNPETESLLKKYWGEDAAYKNIEVYKKADLGNELIEISQGHFVETIIKEYEKSKSGRRCKDFFLTAPTGAGKSLLFQLPAFHVSGKGDVTIVVSPLIALMKDQVKAILSERGFEKVAYLNSELSLIDRDRIIESCKAGEIDILYMSPELLLSYDIKYFLGERKLGLLVVDEAVQTCSIQLILILKKTEFSPDAKFGSGKISPKLSDGNVANLNDQTQLKPILLKKYP